MSPGRPARRFSSQVFLVVAFAIVAVSAVFTAYFVRAQERALEAALVSRARAMAGILSSGARTAVFSENAVLVREMLDGVLGRNDVMSAAVFTLDGAVIAAVGRTAAQQREAGLLDAADRAVMQRLGPGGGCVDRVDGGSLDAYCPVLLRDAGETAEDLYFEENQDGAGLTAIGFVRVSVDRGPLRRAVARELARSLGLMAVILLAGGLAGLHLAQRVTVPLERLTESVRCYGAGGQIGDLSRMSNDEIGRLAEAFVAMTRDLAARERAQAQLADRLRQAQKMEAVGALSQGISHDFKNILSSLKITAYLIERAAPDNEAVLKYTGRIDATIERAQRLVERLLVFSRTQALQRVIVDLGGVVRQAEPALAMALGDQVCLALETPGTPVPVLGDAGALEQLLLNLAYNARDAMPGGGTFTVRLAVRDGAAGGGRVARLTVADTGVGMPPEVRARVFEAFFTTKEAGAGMGLGLSIVRGIVREHDGSIEVESAPGEGTAFHVELPLAGPPGADAGGTTA